MRFVYDTMDRDIANWLRENNPDPSGAQHHHQWLSEDLALSDILCKWIFSCG
jgi:hypothetical protein